MQRLLFSFQCAFFSFDMMNLVWVLNNEKDSPTAAR